MLQALEENKSQLELNTLKYNLEDVKKEGKLVRMMGKLLVPKYGEELCSTLSTKKVWKADIKV